MLAALAPAVTAVRLSLHVLAAAVFVGGQLTLAGLLPTLRGLGPEATRHAARAFARIQWPAYGLLLATGIWNAAAVDLAGQSSTWHVVFWVKVAVAVGAGAAALVHTKVRSRALIGAFGGLAALFSLAALVLGVVIAG